MTLTCERCGEAVQDWTGKNEAEPLAWCPGCGSLYRYGDEWAATYPEAPRDAYHTMKEVYAYRMAYNALAANAIERVAPGTVVKSWLHDDGTMFEGQFVVTTRTPYGDVSNHYDAEHWHLFLVPDAPRAPPWDGHTPATALQRLKAFSRDVRLLSR